MTGQNQFEWTNFYKEFAYKLLEYKDNRDELIEKVKEIYNITGMNMPMLEKDRNIVDIDPFTIFGLFNRKMLDENRIRIISAIKDLFAIHSKIPNSFDSLPVLMAQNALYYNFIDERGEEDIDYLWSLYDSALAYSEFPSEENKKTFSHYFDLVINLNRNGNSKVTMGLYWIAPNTFLNLDSRNEWYIYESGRIPDYVVEKLPKMDKKISSSQYFEIVKIIKDYINSEESKVSDFKELSYDAWIYSEEINQKNKKNKKRKHSSNSTRWYKPLIQALRDLGGSATPAETREKIIENEDLSEEEISITRGKNNVNKFENEVAFTRDQLVKAGYIDKSVYGVWTLTESGMEVDMTKEKASKIYRKVMSSVQKNRERKNTGLSDEDVRTIKYWIYSRGEGSTKWDEFYDDGIMAINWGDIGDLTKINNNEEIKEKLKETYNPELSYKNIGHTLWQFLKEIEIGDVIFVKKGKDEIVGRGIVMSDYEFDSNRNDEFNHIRQIDWTHRGKWKQPEGDTTVNILKDITPYTEYVEKIKNLFEEEAEDIEEIEKYYPIYKKEDFLSEVYMSEEDYNRLTGILRYKKNIILQGPPGVGKTFAAKRLAYSIMEVKDVNRVMMVQFHQSYSYEDFIMGFRPTGEGFELRKGAFYDFCKKAEIDKDNDYFFIIDEINRGNLSKIFGELFMLIENDKRGVELQLLYSDEKFSVPENIYIIGMMNTADRSLAILDYALRRRFAFFELSPGFNTEGFVDYQNGLSNSKFDNLIKTVKELNYEISNDDSLGKEFSIGHSYFCNLSKDAINNQMLNGIIDYELIPLLKEYWFDEPEKVNNWSNKLKEAIK